MGGGSAVNNDRLSRVGQRSLGKDFPLYSNFEIKSRPFFHLYFGPDFSAVSMDDPLNSGQTDSGPLEFAGAMEALKCAEQFIGVGHIESCAVIPDEVKGLSLLLDPAEFDDRCRMIGGELPSIPEQVFQDDLQKARVSVCLQVVLNQEGRFPFRLRSLEILR